MLLVVVTELVTFWAAPPTFCVSTRGHGTTIYLIDYDFHSRPIDVATGGSADWALGTYHTNLAYTFELRDIRGGPHGFILPADQIIPNCLEFLDGIKAMIQTARSLNQL